MGRTHAPRAVVLGPLLAVFTLISAAMALGYVDQATPHVSSAITLTVVLLCLPFTVGLAAGRQWAVAFVFLAVLATGVLPDRTVVEETRNASTTTVYVSDFAMAFQLAVIGALAAWAGVRTRRRAEADGR